MKKMRPIKPEFLRDHGLYAAERETGLPLRLAFAGLLACTDREGRFLWRPEELKLDCLPYDDLDFGAVLDALAARGFRVKYATGGEVFGCVPSWRDHRSINSMEKPSELPEPSASTTLAVADEGRDGESLGAPAGAAVAAVEAAGMGSTDAPEATAPDPSPPAAGPTSAREDPEPPAAPIDAPPEIEAAEPEAAPAPVPEAGPPLNGGGDGLAAEPEPEGADGLAVADVLHEGVDRGVSGGNGRDPEALDGAAEAVPATQAVADADWTWQMDRELYDVMVAAAIQRGVSEAEAIEQVTAHFGGTAPAPLHDPADAPTPSNAPSA